MKDDHCLLDSEMIPSTSLTLVLLIEILASRRTYGFLDRGLIAIHSTVQVDSLFAHCMQLVKLLQKYVLHPDY